MKKISKVFLMCLFCFFVLNIFFGCGGTSLKEASSNLTNYTIEADFDEENNILSCFQKVDYINPYKTTLNNLQFHLYPNAFSTTTNGPVSSAYYSKGYVNGDSIGNIEIQKVKVDNVEQTINVGNTRNEVLYVELNKELYPDERVEIEMNYTVLLPNCWHRFGYGDDTYNFGNFYPIVGKYEQGDFYFCEYKNNGDPFYSDMANYNVTITCNNDFVVASSGKQTKVENTETNKKITKIEGNAIRDFAFVLSKKFNVISGEVDGTTVFYYYYNDDNAKKNLQAGIDSIKTFNDLFGKYPYSTMSVVKADFMHGGMEYPNLVYISDAIEDETEYLNVIVHETAHQWWYNLVGSNACEYAWLDEGLTEYSTLLFYKYNPSYQVDMQKSLNNSLSSYLLYSEICKSIYNDFDESMSRNVNKFKGDMDYVYLTYVKGVLFFDNLSELVGSKNFIKSLKLYFKNYCYKNATPDDMIACFEKVCKKSMTSFFDSWISGKVVLQNY